MGEHDALREPGRAARVRQDGEVGRRVERWRGRVARVAVELLERGQSLATAYPDDRLDAGRCGRLARGLRERGNREEHPCPGVDELIGRLAGGVERVHRRAHAPCRRRGVEGDGVFGQVGHVDPEDVAVAEAAAGEPGGEGANPLRELAIGEGRAGRPVDQRRRGGLLVSELEDERGDIDARDVDVVVGGGVDHLLHPALPVPR